MLKVTLQAVRERPGTSREIAARTNQNYAGVTVELLLLHDRGKVSRVKTPQEKGPAVFVYSVADEAGSPA